MRHSLRLRPLFVLVGSLGLLLLGLPTAGQIIQPEKPKHFKYIAVIVLDDVGVDQLSCYGEGTDFPNTPTICKLAKSGILFRNAWVNPTCSPTRSTIQTGRYAFRTGVTAPGIPLPLGETTLPEVLADQLNAQLGFSTAQIGKWHLAGERQQSAQLPGQRQSPGPGL